MNTLLLEGLKNIYKNKVDSLNKIVSIFTNFFGEESVDFQGLYNEDSFITKLGNTTVGGIIYLGYEKTKDFRDYKNTYLENIENEQLIEIILKELNKKDTSGFDHLINNPFILIYFPNVRITNENDKFFDIKDLYAKICLSYNGTLSGSPRFNRSTYTEIEYYSDYMHSHVSHIPKDNPETFKESCLGYGPLRGTVCSLIKTNDENLWELFCLELSKYITIESLSGGPYHWLERLKDNSRNYEIAELKVITYKPFFSNSSHNSTQLLNNMVDKFIKYVFATANFKYKYCFENFSLAMSPLETNILFSNMFIKWYNNNNDKESFANMEDLYSSKILNKYKIEGNKLYPQTGRFQDHTEEIDDKNSSFIKICEFKGKNIYLHIIKNNDGTVNNVTSLLSQSIVSYIINKILLIINYNYGKGNSDETDKKIKYVL